MSLESWRGWSYEEGRGLCMGRKGETWDGTIPSEESGVPKDGGSKSHEECFGKM